MIQDYGFRLYNPSIGKFLSVDPLAPSYPWYTPYQFAGNKPIKFIDLDGLEEADPWYIRRNSRGKPMLTFGVGRIPTMKKMKYGGVSGPVTEFSYNTLVTAYNNTVQTWNDGFEGKTGTMMFREIDVGIADFTKDATSEDYKNIATDVSTWEGIVAGGLTALLTKKINLKIAKFKKEGINRSFDSLSPDEMMAVKGAGGWPFKKIAPDTKENLLKSRCYADACKIKEKIGGDIIHIRDMDADYFKTTTGRDAPLGAVKVVGSETDKITEWFWHAAVKKDGRFYDKNTGIEGMSIDDYKGLYKEAKYLDFETVITKNPDD